MHEFFGRRAVRLIAVVALLFVVVVLLFLILNWYVAPTKPSERKDLVLGVAQILGGTALLWGLYFSWRTLQVNREGQITERFTRAIDQLGATDDKSNKLFEIRLGGIYALERIAKESEDEYLPIMEILTAYVRQHARSTRGAEPTKVGAVQENLLDDASDKHAPNRVHTLDSDIEAIMTVIRTLSRHYANEKSKSIDLRQTDLRNVNLGGARLQGARLSEANFSGAFLMNTNLQEAHLRETNLQRAFLRWANLKGAFLSKADLQGADLRETDLQGAYLRTANLQETDLREANLQGAHLSYANLQGARLSEANLQEAQLLFADGLTQEQLEEASGDERTKLPFWVPRPKSWPSELNHDDLD